MFPEDCIVLHSYYIVHIIWVVLLQIHQYLQLYTRLVVETLLVTNDLQGHKLVCFVVVTLQGLSEASFP